MSDSLNRARSLIAEGIRLREQAKDKSDLHPMMLKFEEAYDILESMPHTGLNREMGQCLTHIGWGLMNFGAYDEAIGICQKALNLLANDPSSVWDQADCRETIAKAYSHLGDQKEAKKWQLASIDEFLKAGPQQWRKGALQDYSSPGIHRPRSSKKKKWWQFWK